jgi:cytochrome b561
MRLRDDRRSYGWISIALHWSGAALVIAMLFIGNSIRDPSGGAQADMLRLHTTIGLGFYLLFWARVIWRLRKGHPEPSPRQNRAMYRLGRYFHAVLLTALALMLVSGPLMAWAGDLPLRIWSFVVPNPLGARPPLFQVLRAVHVAAATVLGWGTLIHVTAVLKHTVIDRDGAFDRMMVPGGDDQKVVANPDRH